MPPKGRPAVATKLYVSRNRSQKPARARVCAKHSPIFSFFRSFALAIRVAFCPITASSRIEPAAFLFDWLFPLLFWPVPQPPPEQQPPHANGLFCLPALSFLAFRFRLAE